MVAKVQGVEKTIANLRKKVDKIKKDTAKKTDELTKGVYLALSNQAKKVTQKRPTKGEKFSGNGNYKPSDEPFRAFVPLSQGGTDSSQSVEEYIKKIKKVKAGYTNRQISADNRRQRIQQIKLDTRRKAYQRTIDRLEKAMAQQFEVDCRTVATSAKKSAHWKNAKKRIKRRNTILRQSLARIKNKLSKLEQHYNQINKRAERRHKPPRKFKFVNRIGGAIGTDNPQFNEIFRVSGFPRPKSWGTNGEFYLRHNWRTTSTGIGKSLISISPGVKGWNDNQKFLRQLEDGGSCMGGPLYEGYTVIFKQVGRFTHVTFQRRKGKNRKSVTIRPRRFVKRTLDRIKRKLSNHNLSTLKSSDWRSLGSGN